MNKYHKRKLNKYAHIYNGHIEVNEPWKPYIDELLKNFDKELRIKWLPKPLSNFIVNLRFKNRIEHIKTSFGSLKIIGSFSDKFQDYIKETKLKCSKTCELCGNSESSNEIIITTVKGWVYTCCKQCKQ